MGGAEGKFWSPKSGPENPEFSAPPIFVELELLFLMVRTRPRYIKNSESYSAKSEIYILKLGVFSKNRKFLKIFCLSPIILHGPFCRELKGLSNDTNPERIGSGFACCQIVQSFGHPFLWGVSGIFYFILNCFINF
jgi:hypothetical protein